MPLESGIPLLLCALISQASTAASCMYNAVTGYCNLSKKITWSKAVVISGVACSILASTGIVSNLAGFFGTVGYIVPPIGGVLIADYYLLKKSNYGKRPVEGINWYAIGTVVVGVVCSVTSAKVLPNFPNQITGIAVSVILYTVLGKTIPSLQCEILAE